MKSNFRTFPRYLFSKIFIQMTPGNDKNYEINANIKQYNDWKILTEIRWDPGYHRPFAALWSDWATWRTFSRPGEFDRLPPSALTGTPCDLPTYSTTISTSPPRSTPRSKLNRLFLKSFSPHINSKRYRPPAWPDHPRGWWGWKLTAPDRPVQKKSTENICSLTIRYDTIRYIICTEKLTGKLPV